MALHVVATAAGGPEVLELVDEPDREPGPGEVAVEVRAAGVNPVDVKRYGGRFGPPPEFPMHLGSEASGVVTAVGAEAVGPRGRISVGDEVIAYRVDEAYAERIVAPGSAVVPKPAGLEWAPAAGLMLAGVTAVHALTVVDVGPGDTLLFHGAAGGVGIMAIQVAVEQGARVIGTASERNHEFLRSLGAEPVTYGPGLLKRVRDLAPDGVGAAIDGVGTPEALEVSQAVLKDLARFTTIVSSPAAFAAGVKVLGGAPGADPGTEIRNAARLSLVDRIEAGTLQVFIDRTYPLADAAAAHTEIASGHARGKIVLVNE
jgi:NADPH:quinone reductase-like Zn-dependent oxidoreductase